MVSAALKSTSSVDTSYAWFMVHKGESSTRYEGNFRGENQSSNIRFEAVLKAYEDAGKPMLVVKNSPEAESFPGTRFAFDVSRLSGFHDSQIVASKQGREAVLTFRDTSAAFGVDSSLDVIMQMLLESGYGDKFLRLIVENKNQSHGKRVGNGTFTYTAINFDGVNFEPSGDGGAKVYTHGPDTHPLYVKQTVGQITAALASGERFEPVSLPEGPSRTAKTDQAVIAAGKGGSTAADKKLES